MLSLMLISGGSDKSMDMALKTEPNSLYSFWYAYEILGDSAVYQVKARACDASAGGD